MVRGNILGNEVFVSRNIRQYIELYWRNSQRDAQQIPDSAAGGAKSTKTSNQAILPLRGKVKNTTSLELADIIKSDTIKDILTCLGCGIGDNFNINNLRYNRIIILTDADPKFSIGVK